MCTAAERQYALEVWRLLDPNAILIPAAQRRRRLSDRKRVKYLADVLEIGRHPLLPSTAADGAPSQGCGGNVPGTRHVLAACCLEAQ